MHPLLGPDKFTLGDNIQPDDYLKHRSDLLRRLYKRDPRLTRDLVSSVYEHPLRRPWEDHEIRETLGLPAVLKTAFAAMAPEQLKEANEYLARAFPSLSAAVDAYDHERANQEAVDAARYPALYATQPNVMAAFQQSMGGVPTGSQLGSAPPVHHRRHRHHR